MSSRWSLVNPWTRASLAVLCPACLLVVVAAHADDGWQRLRDDDGITTWVREREGAALPVFRARVRIEASLWRVLAVLDDVDRACEWTAHCAEMRRVRRVGDDRMWVYARMDAPWPVRDRDVLTQVRARPLGPGRFVVRIERIRSETHPVRDGIVRMPRFVASYTFRVVGDGQTEVVYQADVDPGGALPSWLKRLVSRDFPHDTLGRLRERVQWSLREDVYVARARELERNAGADGSLATR